MGKWIADQLHEHCGGKPGTVLAMGLTFKEDVPDLRNSRVIDVIRRLEELGHSTTIHDPLADAEEAQEEYGVALVNTLPDDRYDIVFAAVPHRSYREMADEQIEALVAPNGLIADLKGMWRDRELGDFARWTL